MSDNIKSTNKDPPEDADSLKNQEVKESIVAGNSQNPEEIVKTSDKKNSQPHKVSRPINAKLQKKILIR